MRYYVRTAEFLPCGKYASRSDARNELLRLLGAGLEAVHDLVDRVALTVPGLDTNVDVALHAAAHVRDAEAAFEVLELLVALCVNGARSSVPELGAIVLGRVAPRIAAPDPGMRAM